MSCRFAWQARHDMLVLMLSRVLSRVSGFPVASPCLWGSYKTFPFRRFSSRLSCRFRGRRGTLWPSYLFDNVSKVVLCGRRNTLASFSQDELQFSWQAQHFGDLCRHFASQAQHFRRVALRALLSTSHSTLYTLQFTLHTSRSTLHTPHTTLYTPHSALYTLHSTLRTPHSTLYTSHSTLYTPHSTLHTPHFTLYTLHSTLHTQHFTL